MKKIINITRWPLLFGFILLAAASCFKNDDLVTADAKEGGLITPITSNVPYKLANTPQVDVTLEIPTGPAITSIKVYNSFYSTNDTAASNEVMMMDVPVTGSTILFTVTYNDLKKDLLVKGNPLPADETLLGIGSRWTLVYHAVLSDGREVINNAVTVIGVANIYAGDYHVTGVFNHPLNGPRDINEDKSLTAISAYQVTSTTGDLGPDYPTIITVNPTDNTCTVEKHPDNPLANPITMTPGETSYYDPSTGKFFLYYQYEGSGGARVISEEYTPL